MKLTIYCIRFSSKENREAYKEWSLKYDENIMGKVVTEIFNIHKDIETTYELDEEAQDLYEAIVDKFNSQFNLKYSSKFTYNLKISVINMIL